MKLFLLPLVTFIRTELVYKVGNQKIRDQVFKLETHLACLKYSLVKFVTHSF